MHVHGLLLAAGAGRRYGGPKALVPGWVPRAVVVLAAGGCDAVTVVLGAGAEQLVLDGDVATVVAEDWAEGMGASLRAGLVALADTDADAAMVHLVDLPDVTAEVVARVLGAPVDTATLRRATYDGVPGHPVLIGRAHWEGVRAVAVGERGARDYFQEHPPEPVECGDLASGRDVDFPTRDQPAAE